MDMKRLFCCVFLVLIWMCIGSEAQDQPVGNWPLAPGRDVQALAEAVRGAGFSLAGITIRALGKFIPAYTTLMIPTNDAIAAIVTVNRTDLPNILLYHAITQVLPFNLLAQFPVGQKLPTLLMGRTVAVTNNSASNFQINGAKVVRPNMCGNITGGVLTCHGIDRVLIPTASTGTRLAPSMAPGLAPGLAPAAAVQPPSTITRRSPAPAPAPAAVVIPGPMISPGAAPVTVAAPPGAAGTEGGGAPSSARSVSADYPPLLLFLAALGLPLFFLV